MDEILRACSGFFDLILIDSPPILDLADAQILSGRPTARCWWSRPPSVTRKAAKAAVARLKSAKARIVGAALTRIAAEKLGYAYAGSYSHFKQETEEAPAPAIFHYAPWLERDLQRIRSGFAGAAQRLAGQGGDGAAPEERRRDAA